MSNSLNLRIVNRVSTIAQGDTASTVVLELLDQDNLTLPWANGKTAQINFLKNYEVVYQVNAVVFDSRVEFNINGIVAPGKYVVEARLAADDAIYVFPSSVDYQITIAKSSDDYWSTLRQKTDVEALADEMYSRLPADYTGHIADKGNPHQVTAEQVGLGNLDNEQQATKVEFDAHVADATVHVTEEEKNDWNSRPTTADLQAVQDSIPTDLPDLTAINGHIENQELHFTTGEKQALDTLTTQTALDLQAHKDDTENPHNVTSMQVNSDTSFSHDKPLDDYSEGELLTIGYHNKATTNDLPLNIVPDIYLIETTQISSSYGYQIWTGTGSAKQYKRVWKYGTKEWTPLEPLAVDLDNLKNPTFGRVECPKVAVSNMTDLGSYLSYRLGVLSGMVMLTNSGTATITNGTKLKVAEIPVSYFHAKSTGTSFMEMGYGTGTLMLADGTSSIVTVSWNATFARNGSTGIISKNMIEITPIADIPVGASLICSVPSMVNMLNNV